MQECVRGKPIRLMATRSLICPTSTHKWWDQPQRRNLADLAQERVKRMVLAKKLKKTEVHNTDLRGHCKDLANAWDSQQLREGDLAAAIPQYGAQPGVCRGVTPLPAQRGATSLVKLCSQWLDCLVLVSVSLRFLAFPTF
jgi:hypothetical protein